MRLTFRLLAPLCILATALYLAYFQHKNPTDDGGPSVQFLRTAAVNSTHTTLSHVQ